ncbi:MAG: indolepyruvate oxidoreductase subunit beta family protein [Burkholderiales bacterium]|nr:indolepyruvate oxidoreductase subunit beta family protein [Burkholderiales bacterium]
MKPICILVGALGGEGGGVLAQWLIEAATEAGYATQGTSIPGVAQRTGATTYYVEIFPVPVAKLGGRAPVLSLYPVPGAVDLVVASELLETGRIVAAGMASRERTTVVTSTSRTLTTAEKMVMGDGRFDSQRLLEVARKHSRALAAFDMNAAAARANTVVSAVMFGAVAASGVLPFGRDVCERIVRASGRGADASLAGFAAGFEGSQDVVQAAAPAAPARDAFSEFPPSVREIVALGHARTVEFQDAAYGELYLTRVRRVLAAEGAAHDGALTREAARFLALWMCFDDVVRVADLKTRASRIQRVRREVGAADEDVVRIVDHMKPGVPEFAGLLPSALATRLVRWDRSRQARGKAPLAFALKLRTDAIGGFLLLRMLAACRGWRRRGGRFAQEQALIESWLAAVIAAAQNDWNVGNELALCGRLVKGYGATNERGKHNLAHILRELAPGGRFANPAAHAAAIREARVAALADEGGKALDQALVAHGLPARPVVAQPVRWVRKSAATRTGTDA